MKIKHNEIEIDSENPFSNCKLDRQKFSNILTGIINSYSEGFVLAINNKWGTGKTTFIKMWQQDLKNKIPFITSSSTIMPPYRDSTQATAAVGHKP